MRRDLAILLSNASLAFASGRHEDCRRFAVAALKVDPLSSDALLILGVLSGVNGQHSEAEKFLRTAASIDASNFHIFFNLAKSLSEQGKHSDAMPWHQRAVRLDPCNPSGWLNFGRSLYEIGNFAEAIKAFDSALGLDPCLADAFSNRGSCLQALDQTDMAIKDHTRAVELNPDKPEFLNNYGASLNAKSDYRRAIQMFDRAIALSPSFAEAWNNRGVSFFELEFPTEAINCYKRAVEINPLYARAWVNMGNAYLDIRDSSEAIGCFLKAIDIDGDYAEAWYNSSLIQLSLKNFESGFAAYDWRWKVSEASGTPLVTPLPSYSGSRSGGRLLLWCEQGLGDEIFYIGWLRLVLARWREVSFICDDRLHSIVRRSFPEVNVLSKLVTRDSSFFTGFDCHAPIGSLYLLLGVNHDELATTRHPFLSVDEQRVSTIRKGNDFYRTGLRCGISWRSSNPKLKASKSAPIDCFRHLTSLSEFKLVNLQYGEVSEELRYFSSSCGVDVFDDVGVDKYNDMEGLLALISVCDIVVTTSNVTAHLAGAIGKRCYVLVPHSRGRIWYWHLSDANSFWYPSLTLLHQQQVGSWSTEMLRIVDYLSEGKS